MGRPDNPRFGTPQPTAPGIVPPTAPGIGRSALRGTAPPTPHGAGPPTPRGAGPASGRGGAQPSTRGTARRPRGDRRLDPVRRRRPSRGTLLRLAAAVVLLATAAVASWSPAGTCGVQSSSAAASASALPSSAGPASSSPAAAGVVPPGSVGVPIRLADPTALSLVHPGNRVDLLRLDESGGSTAVAAAALVLRVTGAGDPTAGGLLLALSPTEAQRAVADPAHGFAILIRPG